MVLIYKLLNLCLRFCHLIVWFCRVYNFSCKHLTCRVYNCKLAACSESRIPAKNNLAGDRWLKKKLFKILSKNLDCPILCCLCKAASYLSLNSWCNKSSICICYTVLKVFCCKCIVFKNILFKIS